MTVDLQVVDSATLVQRRNNEKMYDIFTTGMSLSAGPDPAPLPPLRLARLDLPRSITSRMDADPRGARPDEAQGPLEEVRRTFYERAVIRYSDLFGLRAMQASVKGYNEKMAFPRFYDVWLNK